MGRFWVKAVRTVIRHNLKGAYVKYAPGDWFECHNQELAELLQQGLVESSALDIRANFENMDAGVLTIGHNAPEDMFKAYGLEVRRGKFGLPWERTALWHSGARLTAEAVVLGLMRVDADDPDLAWEMAAMLDKKSRLAKDIGTEADKARTLEVLGDLRLPVYDTGALWVRRTEMTEEVLRLWSAEVAAGADERHAFLRTIYSCRVLLCTLPADWIGQWMRV